MKYGCAKVAQIRSNRPHLNETFTTWMRVHKTKDHEREIPNECLYCIILIIHTHAATIYYYVCCVSSRWKHMFVKAKDLLSFKRYARANTQRIRLFYIFILVFFFANALPKHCRWTMNAESIRGWRAYLFFTLQLFDAIAHFRQVTFRKFCVPFILWEFLLVCPSRFLSLASEWAFCLVCFWLQISNSFSAQHVRCSEGNELNEYSL